jgi:hypothetical protein
MNRSILYAFYDLDVASPTFDIIHFLLMAEVQRVKFNCLSIHVIIVPGSNNGFREGDNPDLDQQRWRANNILIGCCQLVESIQGFTFCSDRDEANFYFKKAESKIFPTQYKVDKPIARYLFGPIKELLAEGYTWPTLFAPRFAKKTIKVFLESFASDKKVVTINLRNSSILPNRNSNFGEWAKVCAYLNDRDFAVILIDDAESVNQTSTKPLEVSYHGIEFIWNIPLRAALYEQTYINLFVNNGPAALSMHNSKSRCLVFKMITEGADSSSSTRFFKTHGLEIGKPAFFAGTFNRWVWKNDNFDIIIEEFEKIEKEIGP